MTRGSALWEGRDACRKFWIKGLKSAIRAPFTCECVPPGIYASSTWHQSDWGYCAKSAIDWLKSWLQSALSWSWRSDKVKLIGHVDIWGRIRSAQMCFYTFSSWILLFFHDRLNATSGECLSYETALLVMYHWAKCWLKKNVPVLDVDNFDWTLQGF